jgi:hypothetical protein
MDIDPAQPWGIAIDYFGRAVLTDSGHTVQLRIYDQTLGAPLAPDEITGQYPAVYISAQIRETGDDGAELHGFGDTMINPAGAGPVAPDQTSVPAAVAAAVADFQARTASYAALCAAWPPPAADQPPADQTPADQTPGDGGDSDDPPAA